MEILDPMCWPTALLKFVTDNKFFGMQESFIRKSLNFVRLNMLLHNTHLLERIWPYNIISKINTWAVLNYFSEWTTADNYV